MKDQKDSGPTNIAFNETKLLAAIEFSKIHESKMDRNIRKLIESGHFNDPWPHGKILGPIKMRNTMSGAILHKGQTVKLWGDVEYVDMAFSISKSFLSICAGIAFKEKVISDFSSPIRDTIKCKLFETEQNRDITWTQMLQLTSEWEGTLWGKPDWIDHNRSLDDLIKNKKKGLKRKVKQPGSFWEYNDTRVNVLSYALTLAFERSLQDVLRDQVMNPIGASKSWKWHGYRNSWLKLGSKRVQSVSGGAHWGGGLWINTLDLARVGQLMLNKGAWDGEWIIPKEWIEKSTTPCNIAPNYGYLWWLNDEEIGMFPRAPKNAFAAMGVGSQVVYIDPSNELVIVVRWIERTKLAEFIQLILESIIS